MKVKVYVKSSFQSTVVEVSSVTDKSGALEVKDLYEQEFGRGLLARAKTLINRGDAFIKEVVPFLDDDFPEIVLEDEKGNRKKFDIFGKVSIEMSLRNEPQVEKMSSIIQKGGYPFAEFGYFANIETSANEKGEILIGAVEVEGASRIEDLEMELFIEFLSETSPLLNIGLSKINGRSIFEMFEQSKLLERITLGAPMRYDLCKLNRRGECLAQVYSNVNERAKDYLVDCQESLKLGEVIGVQIFKTPEASLLDKILMARSIGSKDFSVEHVQISQKEILNDLYKVFAPSFKRFCEEEGYGEPFVAIAKEKDVERVPFEKFVDKLGESPVPLKNATILVLSQRKGTQGGNPERNVCDLSAKISEMLQPLFSYYFVTSVDTKNMKQKGPVMSYLGTELAGIDRETKK